MTVPIPVSFIPLLSHLQASPLAVGKRVRHSGSSSVLERHPGNINFIYLCVAPKLGLSKESKHEVVYDGPYYSSIIPCAGVNITIPP